MKQRAKGNCDRCGSAMAVLVWHPAHIGEVVCNMCQECRTRAVPKGDTSFRPLNAGALTWLPTEDDVEVVDG